MDKIDIKDVTLVSADGRPDSPITILLSQLDTHFNFAEIKLFKDNIGSVEDYNHFIIKELNDHINSEFCMIVQTDGHPIRPEAWEDEFLKYDYLGAPWYTQLPSGVPPNI